jgi:hypothetical protein
MNDGFDLEAIDAATLQSVLDAISDGSEQDLDPFMLQQQQAHAVFQLSATQSNGTSAFQSLYEVEQYEVGEKYQEVAREPMSVESSTLETRPLQASSGASSVEFPTLETRPHRASRGSSPVDIEQHEVGEQYETHAVAQYEPAREPVEFATLEARPLRASRGSSPVEVQQHEVGEQCEAQEAAQYEVARESMVEFATLEMRSPQASLGGSSSSRSPREHKRHLEASQQRLKKAISLASTSLDGASSTNGGATDFSSNIDFSADEEEDLFTVIYPPVRDTSAHAFESSSATWPKKPKSKKKKKKHKKSKSVKLDTTEESSAEAFQDSYGSLQASEFIHASSKLELEESLASLPDMRHIFARLNTDDEELDSNIRVFEPYIAETLPTTTSTKTVVMSGSRNQLNLESIPNSKASKSDQDTTTSTKTVVMSGSRSQLDLESIPNNKASKSDQDTILSSSTDRLSTRSLPIEMVIAANRDLLGNGHHSAPLASTDWTNFDPQSSPSDGTNLSEQMLQSWPESPMTDASLNLDHSPKRGDLTHEKAGSIYGEKSPPTVFAIMEDASSDAKEKISSYPVVDRDEQSKQKINAEYPVVFDTFYKSTKTPATNVEETDNKYWVSYKQRENQSCLKSKWKIAGVVTALLLLGTGLGLYFGLSSGSSDSPTSMPVEIEPCDVDSLRRQCTIDGRISLFPSCIRERYEELKSDFIPTLTPDFDEGEDSCDSAHLALIRLAARTTGDESIQELENRYLLSILYFSTEGRHWFNSNLWSSPLPPCSWFGVSCNANFEVTELGLGNNNLGGTFPTQLGLLSSLQSLHLSGNDIGSSLPSEIATLTSLLILDVRGNALNGTIPSEIGQLSALGKFDAAFNMIRGKIPRSIGGMIKLASLYLNNNNLTGEIPSEIQFCRDLVILVLNSNELSSAVPSQLGALPSIEVIELESNIFIDSTIPTELGQLSTLLFLDIDGSGIVGSLPTELGNLSALTVLRLGSSTLSGTIPTEFAGLTSLEVLHLNLNSLSGTLPSQVGEMQQLTRLDVSYNRMKGTLPTELGHLTNLRTLLVLGNFFVGQVPSELCSLWNAELEIFLGDYCGGNLLSCTTDPTCCPGCQ